MWKFKTPKNTSKIAEIAGKKLKFFTNIGIILVTLFFGVSLIKNIARVSKVKARIAEAEARAAKLNQDNKELKTRLAEVNSDFFVEKKLRDNLGLAKEGETVVVLPEAEILRKLAPDVPQEATALPEANWEKWVHLFVN